MEKSRVYYTALGILMAVGCSIIPSASAAPQGESNASQEAQKAANVYGSVLLPDCYKAGCEDIVDAQNVISKTHGHGSRKSTGHHSKKGL